MNKIDDKIDLSKLPDEAKKELYDFYIFLLTKYSVKKNKEKNNNKEEDDSFINGLIPRKIKNTNPINRDNNYAR